ncbi:MAG: hypothetical protein R3360_09185 [Alphaproteobacteria bacterium]|nr:hypothetical protein [Alphaproteobacteria bacterium]
MFAVCLFLFKHVLPSTPGGTSFGKSESSQLRGEKSGHIISEVTDRGCRIKDDPIFCDLAGRGAQWVKNTSIKEDAAPLKETGPWVKPAFLKTAYRISGQVKLPEHVEDGIDSFPEALKSLFEGQNIGKFLVKP